MLQGTKIRDKRPALIATDNDVAGVYGNRETRQVADMSRKNPPGVETWSRTSQVRGYNSASGNSYVIKNPGDHPDFDPLAWARIAAQVNCYTYALNSPEMGMSAPGNVANRRGQKMAEFGLNAKDITAEAPFNDFVRAVIGAAGADGLEAIETLDDVKDGHYPVALYVGNAGGNDFHWLRQDSDGGWSHKMGPDPVTRTDQTGENITDPKNAKFSFYQFAGLFQIPAKDNENTPAQRLIQRKNKTPGMGG